MCYKMKILKVVCWLNLFAACSKSYPGLYAPIVDSDNPNPEMTGDRIPVMISLTDPFYSVATGKRIGGPFGAWDKPEERAKWLESDFRVYAFLTPNHSYKGGVDYTANEMIDEMSVPYCLVNDRSARITAACEMLWKENVPFYNVAHPEYSKI